MHSTMTAEVRACDELGITTQVGKWLVMLRYCGGFTTLEATQAAFAAHPEWKHA